MRWGLAFFILAVIGAVAVEEVVAEKFLNAVKQVFYEPWQLRLDRHLKNVKVLVGAQLFVVLVRSDLLNGFLAQSYELFVLALAD